MSPDPINRREALRRTALLLGGAISAPTLAAMLAGCEAPRTPESGWAPTALQGDQPELVATIAELILPQTDTPGARAVGVHRFIDTMLAEYYSPAARARFLAGLAGVDDTAQRIAGTRFLSATPEQRHAVLTELDRDAYPAMRAAPGATPPFFRTMKELTLLGYYTSQEGMTRELQHQAVPGRFEGCVPLATVGRAWA